MIKLYSLWNFGHKKLYKIAEHIFISLIQFMHGIVYIEYIPLIYGVNFFLFDGNINGAESTNYMRITTRLYSSVGIWPDKFPHKHS